MFALESQPPEITLPKMFAQTAFVSALSDPDCTLIALAGETPNGSRSVFPLIVRFIALLPVLAIARMPNAGTCWMTLFCTRAVNVLLPPELREMPLQDDAQPEPVTPEMPTVLPVMVAVTDEGPDLVTVNAVVDVLVEVL